MSEFILEMKNINKDFPGSRVLDDVTFQLRKCEVHGLCGENGAGKSTLMKILSGIYPYGSYDGEIFYEGNELKMHSPKDSETKGIAIIHQEFALVEEMSVAENIFLGSEISRFGEVKQSEMISRTKELLNNFNLNINPTTKVKNLGVGFKQMVEIAKALSKNASILILDEPTASLTEVEVKHLYDIIHTLVKKGVTCIYISHKLKEIMDLTDNVTILRDGKTVATKPTSELNEDKIISMMVGRDLSSLYPKEPHEIGEVILEVRDYSVYRESDGRKMVDQVSFELHKGEILGISGLVGAGRTELVSSIFGTYRGKHVGEVRISGKPIKIKNSVSSLRNGISMVPEDRKNHGIVGIMSVKKNTSLANISSYSGFLNHINDSKETVAVKKIVDKLHVKASSLNLNLSDLSGGNQQKVVLAKNLLVGPRILIVDEPTRGIDVGAKWEIYKLMSELVKTGISIIMVSSELPEILGISDRILIMNEGKLKGEMVNNNLTEESIMKCALGGN